MKKDRSIDLKQHTLPPVSKWYLIRIIFYVVLLVVLGCFVYFFMDYKQPIKDSSDVEEIHGIQIIVEE